MDIYINKFEDAHPNDIKNINIMNHYVGMKDIPEVIPEFEIFPVVCRRNGHIGCNHWIDWQQKTLSHLVCTNGDIWFHRNV